MKKIMISVLALISINSAFATSLWYNYCDAASDAYSYMREYYPSIDIAPEKKCSKVSYVFPETSACIQKLVKLRFSSLLATFNVSIETENDGVLSYTLEYQGFCKLRSIKLN